MASNANGSNIGNPFGPAPKEMGELTPPGLDSYPTLPAGVQEGIAASRKGQRGPGPLINGGAKMGNYKV